MKKTKKLIMFLAVGLTLLTPVLGLIPPTNGRAYAAPSDDATPEEQLKSYLYTRALARCLDKADQNQRTEIEMNDYKWFNTREDTYIGYLDEEFGDGDNGKLDCKDGDDGWIQDAFDVWGWGDLSPVEQACNIGWLRWESDQTANIENCINGSGGFVQRGDFKDEDVKVFLTAVNKQFYGKDSTALPTMPSYLYYLYYHNSFLILCSPTVNKAGDNLDPHPVEDYISGVEKGNNIGGDEKYFRMVNSTGTETVTYKADKKSGDEVSVRVKDDLGEQKRKCGDIVNEANKSVTEYIAYMNANPDEVDTAAEGDIGSATGVDVDCGGYGSILANPLNWLSCAALGAMTAAATQLDGFIMGMLCVSEQDIFGDRDTCTGANSGAGNTSEAFYDAWNVFRLLALAMLAIGGLVMILSQALGFELFDAYTIKKVLPRILIAGIGISLSWELLSFLVTLSNALGIGIRGLIYAPFVNNGIDTAILGGGSAALTSLLLGGAMVTLGALGLVTFVGTAFLAILIAFFTLVLRNILVILLIISAPIGIAAYILPNTEKYYKIWWEWLFKALMVFPIITAMIAVGHIFAAITSQKGGDFTGFVAIAAYFAPYFLIPAAFRFAGGALATIGGFANDRSRGGFDRLKKIRSDTSARNLHSLKEGNRFRNNTALTRGFNRSTRAIAAAPAAGFNPAQWRSRYSGAETQKIFDEAEELRTKNTDFMSGMQDDRVLRAILRGGHEGRTGIQRELAAQGITGAELDTTTGIAERMQFAGSQEAVMAAAAIHQASTGTGYENVGEMLDTIASVSGGNRALGGKMLGSMRSAAERSGRHDLGSAGFGVMANQLGQVYDHGQGSADRALLEREAFSSVDVTTLSRGRGESVRNLSAAAAEHVNSITDDEERGRYQAQLENFVSSSRDYGALQRSHEAHEGAEQVAPPRRMTARETEEYKQHRSPRAYDPNDPSNPPPTDT